VGTFFVVLVLAGIGGFLYEHFQHNSKAGRPPSSYRRSPATTSALPSTVSSGRRKTDTAMSTESTSTTTPLIA
jgi:hypothetical protein